MSIEKITVEKREISRETTFFHQIAEPNSVSCRAHIHSTIELLYVVEGSYRVTADGDEYNIFAGDLTLFSSNTIHHVTAGGEARNSYYVMKIPPTIFLSVLPRESAYEYVMRFALKRPEHRYLWRADELAGTRMLSIIEDLIREHDEMAYAYDVSIALGITSLLVEILRETEPIKETVSTRTAEIIYRVIEHISRHYSDELDERAIAAEIGMSYSYFSRTFKRITGSSFREHLNHTRIARAEQLLLRTGKPISEIASECGYNSLSYFISVYKRLTGKTPTAVLKSS